MRAVHSEFLKSAADLSQAPPPELPEVAFLGRSNVGKSSMINSLLVRRKLARVSNTPGRTQLLNFFKVDVEVSDAKTLSFSLCDLPGYGYAKAPREEIGKWKSMIERYLTNRDSLRAAVALIDSRHGPSPQDTQLFAWLESLGRPMVIVATKLDKLTKSQRMPALQQIAQELGQKPIGFSAETGEGREEVWQAVLGWAGGRAERGRKP